MAWNGRTGAVLVQRFNNVVQVTDLAVKIASNLTNYCNFSDLYRTSE